MSEHGRLGVAFIGAGGICEQRHLPALAKFPEVELISVCNRSLESSRRVREKWGFRDALQDWRQVLDQQDVDVVFIGAWPYVHREFAVAALAAGKHVFCQARMCMNAEEATAMVAAAAAHPELVNMICPSPHRVRWERTVKNLLGTGAIGDLKSVVVASANAANCDPDNISWREQAKFSGLNILQVGIFAETLNAWCGSYDALAATTRIYLREKRDPQGKPITIDVPQVVSIAGTLAGGAIASEHHSGLACGYERSEILLMGSAGSCTVDLLAQQVLLHQTNAEKSATIVVDSVGDQWQVERQFITAVLAARRGAPWRVSPDFAEASAYMRKLQAIHDSAAQSRIVQLSADSHPKSQTVRAL